MSKIEKDEDSLLDSLFLCNVCEGTTLIHGKDNDGVDRSDWSDDYGLTFEYETGYHSKCLSDGQRFKVRLCEECLTDLLLKCKISPKQSDCRGGYTDVYSDDDCFDDFGGLKPEKE